MSQSKEGAPVIRQKPFGPSSTSSSAVSPLAASRAARLAVQPIWPKDAYFFMVRAGAEVALVTLGTGAPYPAMPKARRILPTSSPSRLPHPAAEPIALNPMPVVSRKV